jgi:hypothetical protein
MQSISGQGMPVEALTCLPGNDLRPPVALWDAAPAEACDSAASAVGPARRPLSLQSKKHEVAAYTAVHLANSLGQDVSFEEVRAAKWLARQTNIVLQVRCSFCDIPYTRFSDPCQTGTCNFISSISLCVNVRIHSDCFEVRSSDMVSIGHLSLCECRHLSLVILLLNLSFMVSRVKPLLSHMCCHWQA